MAGFSDAMLAGISARFKALGEPMRLRILDALRRRELTVGGLVAQLGAQQANISKHLALLHRDGLVARRRDGMHVYYSVADPSVFELCDLICGSLADRAGAQAKELRRSR